MAFERERENVSADELLAALADGDDIQLSGCTVTGHFDINRLLDGDGKFRLDKLQVKATETSKVVTLPQSIVFDKCSFEDNVVFSGPWSEPDSVSVEFKTDVVFNSSAFKAQARFRNAVFGGNAGFDGCTFSGVVTFKQAVIHKAAKFRTVLFNGYGLFGNAVFKQSARFANTHFAKGANFSNAQFFGQTDFGGVYSSARSVPVYDSIFFALRRHGDDESFWRFVKQSAQEAGYYQLAGECFYKERCARLWQKLRGPGFEALHAASKMLRMITGLRLLPELIFGRLLFGYGERPVRVLLASALIVVLCAFLYSQPGALIFRDGPTEPSFSQSLYFSTITFTTLGYGDFYPSPHGFCRFLAMAEAVAGGCLIALFIVCLAKRFSRG